MTRWFIAALGISALLGSAGTAAAAPQFTAGSITPTGWSNSDRAVVGWTLTGVFSSPAGIRVEMSTAEDGSADAGWIALWQKPLFAWGPDQAEIPLGGHEGRRAIRAVAWDSSGSTARYLGTLQLDRTPPRSQRIALTPDRSGATITWTQDDNGRSGTSALTLETEIAPGSWRSQSVGLGDGAAAVHIDLHGLPDGTYPTRIRATDRAGNTGVTEAPPVGVDHAPPVVSLLAVTRPDVANPARVEVRFTASDAIAGIADGAEMAVIDPTTGSRYHHFTGVPGQNATTFIPPLGTHPMVVRVTDAVGNVGLSGFFEVATSPALSGAPSLTDPREQELVTSVLRVDVGGAVASGRNRTVAVPFGRTVTVTGMLTRADGTPLGGAEIEARDAAQVVRGRTLTRSDGSYALRLSPGRGGPHRIGVPLADDLLPAGAPVIRVRMAPRVMIRASHTRARARGAAVAFTGRIQPSPASFGLTTKNVVFEWRDPIRQQWRPMVNTRVRADGTVRTSWAFGTGGFRVPVRLRLTSERGWPTMEGVSNTVTIRVQ